MSRRTFSVCQEGSRSIHQYSIHEVGVEVSPVDLHPQGGNRGEDIFSSGHKKKDSEKKH